MTQETLTGIVYRLDDIRRDYLHVRIVEDKYNTYYVTAYTEKAFDLDVRLGDVVKLKVCETDASQAPQYEVVTVSRHFVITNKSKDKEMTTTKHNMSKDRVKFYIGHQYFDSQDKINKLFLILDKAFNTNFPESESLIKRKNFSTDGFYVTCRPSQFARFLIYRDGAGLRNGFKDLNVELFTPEKKKTGYARLAEKADVSFENARVVANMLKFNSQDVEDRLTETKDINGEIDVSGRPFCP